MDGWISSSPNDTEPNSLFINQGDGTFKEQGLLYGATYGEGGDPVSSMGADAKDFDNDGGTTSSTMTYRASYSLSSRIRAGNTSTTSQ
jgi:hypothetical protein